MADTERCTTVRQIRLRARPTSKHPSLKGWQTVGVAILVRDEDPQRAVARAYAEVTRRHFEVLERQSAATVDEDRLAGQENEILETYQRAVAGELVFMEFPEQLDLTSPGGQMLAPPVLDESRFDEVISLAGGKRITDLIPEQDQKNADYLLGGTIFELKTLEENGLDQATRREKLARLFLPHAEGSNCLLDPERLSPKELLVYLDIMGSPIKTHVKKAAVQVKASQKALGDDSLRGGIIVLNTGFPALGVSHFADQVARYARKDTSSIVSVVAISVWMESNGFDSIVHYAFSPHEGGDEDIEKLRTSYKDWFEQMMTDLMRGRIPQEEWTMVPSEASGFTVEGVTYRWEPGRPPNTLAPTT